MQVFRGRLYATSTDVLLEARRRLIRGDLGALSDLGDVPTVAEAQNRLLSLLDEVLGGRGVSPTQGLDLPTEPAP